MNLLELSRVVFNDAHSIVHCFGDGEFFWAGSQADKRIILNKGLEKLFPQFHLA